MDAYPARWRASQKGNPFAEQELAALRTEFGKKLIALKFGGKEPNGFYLVDLELCGNLALDRSRLFWGSDDHPEHLHLKNLVRGGRRQLHVADADLERLGDYGL